LVSSDRICAAACSLRCKLLAITLDMIPTIVPYNFAFSWASLV
jgi:hypothetical protein